jgi:hypothetical protein
MAFQEYAPYRRRNTDKKLICSTKMPFTIHSVTTKLTQFVAHEKAVSSMAFQEYAPYRRRNTEKKMICSPNKMPLTIHSLTKKPTQFVAYGKAVSSMAFQEYTPNTSRNTEKTYLFSKQNALHYTQCNNETNTVCRAWVGSK